MPNYSFILRTPYKRGVLTEVKERKKAGRDIKPLLNPDQTKVYLIVGFDRDHRFKCKTDLQAYPYQWDFEKQRLKWQAAGSQSFNQRLSDILEDVQDYYTELKKEKEDLTFEQLKLSIQEFVESNIKPISGENGKSFFEVFDEFIKRKGKDLHPRTIQKFNTSKKLIEKFASIYYKRFSFDDIDVNFIDKYKSYLQYEAENQKTGENEKGFRDDTVAKYIENLKNFLRWGYERGFHKNLIFQHSQFRAKRDVNLDIVTLSIQELKYFFEFDFSKDKKLETARDVFCFGTFTGQRWSDVTAFKKEDLRGDTWIFESYKTKKETIIPLVGYASPALNILKKYNFELPVISNQKFNDNLKLAAAKAELNREVEIIRFQGAKKLTIVKPLHKVISSHMARRTAVSILLNVYNMPVSQVMEITGHSDFKTLKRYINKDHTALRSNLENTISVSELVNKVNFG